MAIGPVVGIDLGTTNTVVALVQNGQAAALADEGGDKLIPSVVSFHPNGNVLVGRAARARRLNDATNTIYSVKRLIGRSWNSEEVRQARARFPFEMREGPGQAALVVARGETYTLPEISAFVLRKAKTIAESALGQQVERAVITVPANFNDLQRAATKVAGRVAGLEVLRILNEPTAAALAYGYGKGGAERLAVYDFGGGTFDVTLLDLSDNVFEVLATAGNTFLGGDDIDLAIAEQMAGEFLAQHRYDVHTDPQAYERLRSAAELIKVRLSSLQETSVDLQEVAHGPGGKALGLTFSMTQAELVRLARPIVEKTFDVCREALGIARMQAGDFDQVLLVGGSTRIPLVRDRVEDFFKREALGKISPDEVVAIGAAIQASALTSAERRRGAIPEPPQPASRGSQPPSARKSAPPPIPQRGGTLPPGAPRPSTPGMFPAEEPQTLPFGRERMPTSPGLQPGSGVKPLPASGQPMIVQPPGRSGNKAPTQPRQRRATGAGLGAPPETLAGLGARGRVPTGTGLGPDAERARMEAEGAGSTLTSAKDAAREARRRALQSHADISLPLVGSDDAEVEDQTTRSSAAQKELTPEQVAEKYGNLPLIMPGEGPGPAPATTEESVPAYSLDSADLEEVPGAPPAGGTQRMPAAPPPRRGSTSSMFIEEDLEQLPVPGAAPPPPRRTTSSSTFIAPDVEQLPIPGLPGEAPPAPPPAPGQPPPEQWGAPQQYGAQPAQQQYAQQQYGAQPAQQQYSAQQYGAQPAQQQYGAQQYGAQPPPLQPAAPRIQEMAPQIAPPLLVDVTPLSLTVETVRGFCDTIIERNTPVPVERTRNFVTAADQQTVVRVRVGQGESSHFADNTLLGEVELSGLRAAPRGQVAVAVTFALDTDGILNVRATDTSTGRAAETRVRLVGMPDAAQIAQMTARQATHPTL